MAILTLISMVAVVSSALADIDPEDAMLMIAVNPVDAADGVKFPCEDIFSSSVLNAFRRTAVSQFKKSIDTKKINQIDGLILMKTLNEILAQLDSGLFNLTSEYHDDCKACEQSISCCLESRVIWARHSVEALSSNIASLCAKASNFKLTAADCETPLKQINPSNDMAEVLRCEAQCKYATYAAEPICASNYK